MIDPSAQAFTAQGVYRVGIAVTFQRLTGFAPDVVTISAGVIAKVSLVTADSEESSRTGYSSRQVGSISHNDRQVVVMAADLAAEGFPLPVAEGDKIVIASTEDKFSVTRVDNYKRAMAGAIELIATGVP